MPADYLSTARALAVSTNPNSPSLDRADEPPPWVRTSFSAPTSPVVASNATTSPSSTRRPFSSRRLSTATRFSRHANVPWHTRLVRTVHTLFRRATTLFLALPLWQRVLAVLVALASLVLGILFLTYSHRIFAWLGPWAKKWRALPAGWLIIWCATFVTAFPPMIGYSTAVSIAGFVYGFPLGWPIVATANVAGSLAAFLASRTVLSGYVHRLVGKDHRFVALGQVLRRDGLGMLTAVRFCPLPYSLSNGFLATIPSITPWAFAASTTMASPKLLVHVFIGSRLALLAEEGDSMSSGDKAINYLSMLIGGILGLVVGILIYNRTMARAKELALEAVENAAANGTLPGSDEEDADPSVAPGYADLETGLLDPDVAAALMDDDDISLWENDGFDNGYTDEEHHQLQQEGVELNGGAKTNGFSGGKKSAL